MGGGWADDGCGYMTGVVYALGLCNALLTQNEKKNDPLVFSNTQGAAVLVSSSEVRMLTMVAHTVSIGTHVHDGLNYIEAMLTQQLTAAIGKDVDGSDFDEFMIHHNKTLFKPEFAPVRRLP